MSPTLSTPPEQLSALEMESPLSPASPLSFLDPAPPALPIPLTTGPETAKKEIAPAPSAPASALPKRIRKRKAEAAAQTNYQKIGKDETFSLEPILADGVEELFNSDIAPLIKGDNPLHQRLRTAFIKQRFTASFIHYINEHPGGEISGYDLVSLMMLVCEDHKINTKWQIWK